MNAIKSFIYNQIIPVIGKIFNSKNKYVNIIYYHDVVKEEGSTFMRINIDTFKRQMQYLVDNNYQTLTFSDLSCPENCLWGRKKVVITFDDGWKSNYFEIFEYMKNKGIKYNIYLAVGEIGKNPDYLTWEQVREMHVSGFVGFGAHTFTHPNMSDITSLDLKHEINDANSIIESNIGVFPKDFCFPFGAYSQGTLSKIIDLGIYDRIYTSDLRYSYMQNGAIVFGRNAISNNERFSTFVKKVLGYYNVFSFLTRR